MAESEANSDIKKTSDNIILLRDVMESDLPNFFEHQVDPEANHMAAFTSKDPSDHEAFIKKWSKMLADESVTIQTIIFNGQVAGSVLCHSAFGEPEVSYWIDKQLWGKGIATQALILFLDYLDIRPLLARVVKDNIGSIRVLEKCGFKHLSEDKGFANARGKEVEEYIMKLN